MKYLLYIYLSIFVQNLVTLNVTFSLLSRLLSVRTIIMSTKAKSGTDKFNSYLLKYKDDAIPESMEGYYHADVVAEAYSQGFSDGKLSGKQDFIAELIKKQREVFSQKANQVYILSHNVISFLKTHNFPISSMHINLNHNCPRVILSVPSETLNNDEFVEKAYRKIFENKQIFSQLFPEILDLGLVASDNLDIELLKEDGFGYSEEY